MGLALQSKKVSSYIIWLVSRNKEYLDVNYRVLFYKAYIQPHLDYCCIWGNTTSKNIHKILRLQKRACKIILGTNYSDFSQSLKILEIQRFGQHLFQQNACFMFKTANSLLSEYICSMYKQKEPAKNSLILQSITDGNFHIPKQKSELFKQSLQYSGPVLELFT